MKFKTFCYKCLKEKSQINIDVNLSISENDLYQFKCLRGHLNLVELQVFKFEILFESGLCAIRDKYYMESVLSLTASLERFYEFFVKIILKSQQYSPKSIEDSFKQISKQSERQLGAFYIVYFQTFGQVPRNIKPKLVEFRNKVVHQGYLPDELEVMEYAREVYDTIKESYIALLTKFSRLIISQQNEIQVLRREKYKNIIQQHNIPITTIAPTLTLTHVLNLEGFKKSTFDDSYTTLVKNGLYL